MFNTKTYDSIIISLYFLTSSTCLPIYSEKCFQLLALSSASTIVNGFLTCLFNFHLILFFKSLQYWRSVNYSSEQCVQFFNKARKASLHFNKMIYWHEWSDIVNRIWREYTDGTLTDIQFFQTWIFLFELV